MAQIKDLKRMCEYYSDCEDCPLYINCTRPDNFSDDTDEIVDNWVKEHPVKTYAMYFFEKFPNAAKTANGLPVCCWTHLYGDEVECLGECEECWKQEMKENG